MSALGEGILILLLIGASFGTGYYFCLVRHEELGDWEETTYDD